MLDLSIISRFQSILYLVTRFVQEATVFKIFIY